MITADARVASLDRARAAGANGVSVKPYDPDVYGGGVQSDWPVEEFACALNQIIADAIPCRARANAALRRSIERRMRNGRVHARYDAESPRRLRLNFGVRSAFCSWSTRSATLEA